MTLGQLSGDSVRGVSSSSRAGLQQLLSLAANFPPCRAGWGPRVRVGPGVHQPVESVRVPEGAPDGSDSGQHQVPTGLGTAARHLRPQRLRATDQRGCWPRPRSGGIACSCCLTPRATRALQLRVLWGHRARVGSTWEVGCGVWPACPPECVVAFSSANRKLPGTPKGSGWCCIRDFRVLGACPTRGGLPRLVSALSFPGAYPSLSLPLVVSV